MKRTLTLSIRIPVDLLAAILREYPPEAGVNAALLSVLEERAHELHAPRQSTAQAWQTLAELGVSPRQTRQALASAPPERTTRAPEAAAPALPPELETILLGELDRTLQTRSSDLPIPQPPTDSPIPSKEL